VVSQKPGNPRPERRGFLVTVIIAEIPMKLVPFRSRYDPKRGGHAPGDLRDVFCDAVEKYAGEGEFPRVVELREQRVPLAYVCSLLRNCTDVLPGWVGDELEASGLLAYTDTCAVVSEIPYSYAGAARYVKSMLAKAA
jgi:hypothetical protein